MQSPLLALPTKETRDVDLVKPMSHLIVKNYEQDPATFADELRGIAQVRQDATGRASTETTGRDLLFRYFHIIEMLELRFPELEVPFTWLDSFSHNQVEQTALAYEKACVLFNTAARITHISAQFNRSDANTDGLKRAYTGFRQAAGLLQYVKDSFLYAPSDDMKGPSLESLVKLMLAQASEIFLEKTIHDKKGDGLISKLACHTATSYASLLTEWNDEACTVRVPYMWHQLVECKSNHFTSVAHMYRAKADRAAGKHGDALARHRYAEVKARLAVSQATLDTWSLATYLRPTLPVDATAALKHLAQVQLTNAGEACREAERDNDVVYHERAPDVDTLPPLDQTSVATAIPIREIFSQSEVQRVLGADVLPSLVPLTVLQNASVYTEEQAKLVRAESARIDAANERIPEAFSALNLPDSLERFASLDGAPLRPCIPSSQVLDMSDELVACQACTRVDRVLESLPKRSAPVVSTLDDALADLDTDARECERGRVQHAATWTQAPTASVARALRRDIHAARDALATAKENDLGMSRLWDEVREDVALLERGRSAVSAAYEERAHVSPSMDLIDADLSDPEPARRLYVELKAHLNALERMPLERQAMLQELKQRVRHDDISRTLLLHRRVQNVEQTLFAQELGKYAPLQKQIRHHITLQSQRIDVIRDALERLATHPGAADVRRHWDASEGAARDMNERLSRAYNAYTDVQRAVAQAQVFYDDMSYSANQLAAATERLVAQRRAERASFLSSADHVSNEAFATSSAANKTTTLAQDLEALRMNESHAKHRGGAPPPPPPPRLLSSSSFTSSLAQSFGRATDQAPTGHTMSSDYADKKPVPPPRPPRV